MDSKEFRKVGKQLIDYIAEYKDTIAEKPVISTVKPGYLRKLIPKEPPSKEETWESIMEDLQNHILPGITHWNHPCFYAFFPAGNSFPSILGEMLSTAFNCNGFSWASSPVCTELETIVVDWLGHMIGLPDDFLFFEEGSKGGGVLQSSASECTFLCLAAARHDALKELRRQDPTNTEGNHLSSLVAYCSKEAHSSVEKAAHLALIKLRIVDTDEKFRLRGPNLALAIEDDVKSGYHPFFVTATFGSTSCASCDALQEIGPICEKYQVWLHVDGAYGGGALICPEMRPLFSGISYAQSFNMNPPKTLLVNIECSAMWVKNRFKLTSCLIADTLYLKRINSQTTLDYRHWSLSMTRRFRALKLWFVIKKYGVDGLQKHVRKISSLAKLFERILVMDKRFELKNEVDFGLVCFRLKGSNYLNERFLKAVIHSGLYLIAASIGCEYVIRFCVTYEHATEDCIVQAWEVIKKTADEILEPPEI